MHDCPCNPRHGWSVDRWHWLCPVYFWCWWCIQVRYWWCLRYLVLMIRSCMILVNWWCLEYFWWWFVHGLHWWHLYCWKWSKQPVISHARVKGWCDNQELKSIICQTNSACYIWMILSRLNYFLSRSFQRFCRMALMRWFKHKSHGRLLMFCTLSKLGFIIALLESAKEAPATRFITVWRLDQRPRMPCLVKI